VTQLDPIQNAIDALGRGEFVIVMDGDLPESEGVLVGTAASLTPEATEWMVRHSSGVVCVPISTADTWRPSGHARAAIELCRLANQPDVGAVTELTTSAGEAMTLAACRSFADEHGLSLVSTTDLKQFRGAGEHLVAHFAKARLPTSYGEFVAHAYRSVVDGEEHVAYVMGDVVGGEPPLVRVHSECLTGDILASIRCDCGPQLQLALQMIAEEGRGVLVYLRGHEGRGIGIGHKLRAYALQDAGLDTVDANSAQGLPVDSREYGVGAAMLADLGVRQMRLMTNNPTKLGGLDGYGLEVVERVAIEIPSNPENLRYLETKRTRMGHTLGEAQA
jgi:3,4-dihydroxy 2-butanone 4-phosphate synthase/GTP cyclohydrolase II